MCWLFFHSEKHIENLSCLRSLMEYILVTSADLKKVINVAPTPVFLFFFNV